MIEVRKGEARDKERYIELEREFCKYYRDRGFDEHLSPAPYEELPELFFERTFTDALADDKFFFIAEEASKVVGYVLAERVESDEPELYGATGHVNSLFVSGHYCGHGVGTKLLEEAFQWMKSQGLSVCTIGAVVENEEALALYKKLGFEPERLRLWKKL